MDDQHTLLYHVITKFLYQLIKTGPHHVTNLPSTSFTLLTEPFHLEEDDLEIFTVACMQQRK